jgi:hypothetical protein
VSTALFEQSHQHELHGPSRVFSALAHIQQHPLDIHRVEFHVHTLMLYHMTHYNDNENANQLEIEIKFIE